MPSPEAARVSTPDLSQVVGQARLSEWISKALDALRAGHLELADAYMECAEGALADVSAMLEPFTPELDPMRQRIEQLILKESHALKLA